MSDVRNEGPIVSQIYEKEGYHQLQISLLALKCYTVKKKKTQYCEKNVELKVFLTKKKCWQKSENFNKCLENNNRNFIEEALYLKLYKTTQTQNESVH